MRRADVSEEIIGVLAGQFVRQAPRSDKAKAKEKTKQTEDGAPVHSFRTLLQDLGTLAMNKIRINGNDSSLLTMNTVATDLQKRVFDLLGATQ